MEVIVLDQILSLEEAPVHVAPGGSLVCTINGKASSVSSFLRNLRGEIAYGMVSFKTVSSAEKLVEAVIYLGSADSGELKSVASNAPDCKVTVRDLPEGSTLNGLSMRARNQIINALD